MRRLAEAGLTTREACGSAVRNVAACPDAGVAKPTSCSTSRPTRRRSPASSCAIPLAAALPRKFKIAFEGCPVDHALTPINDLGWRARVDAAGRRGFRVTVAGGTSILPRSGELLYEFLPAGQILDVTEAVLRVFRARGDFKHKQRNRLKFLVRDLGFPAWRAAFEEARVARCGSKAGSRCRSIPIDPPVEEAPAGRAGAPSVGAVESRAASARLTGPRVAARGGAAAGGGRRVPALGGAPTCGRRSRPASRSPPSRSRWAT